MSVESTNRTSTISFFIYYTVRFDIRNKRYDTRERKIDIPLIGRRQSAVSNSEHRFGLVQIELAKFKR